MKGYVRLSYKVLLPLAVLQFIFALFPVLELVFKVEEAEQAGSAMPTFLNWRDPHKNGLMFMQNRVKQHPVHYVGLHAVPTLIWCIAMLVQHSDSIRRKRARIHRVSGYVAALMSLTLACSGIAFPLRKHLFGTEIIYTHSNPLHLHTLKLYGRTVLVWPTFTAALAFIGPAQLWALYRLVDAARNKRYLEHQTWSVVYTIFGFTIALQRVGMILGLALGAYIHLALSEETKRALGVPMRNDINQWNAELSSFALTTFFAFFASAAWAAHTFRNGKAVWRQKRKGDTDHVK